VLRISRCAVPRFSGSDRFVIDFGNRSTLNAWQIAWSRLQACVQSDGLAALLPNGRRTAARSMQTELLAGRARCALPRLVASTRELDVATSLSVAIPLVGAGPGLTPSWDDFLVGYMCGLRAAALTPGQACFLRRFGAAIHEASAATTAVSRSYIEGTVNGFAPAWVADVLAAIAAGDPELTSCTAERALRVGSTSGTDMMVGTVLGSSAWQRTMQAVDVLAALSCHDPAAMKATQLN
jgi:hypothetical protein